MGVGYYAQVTQWSKGEYTGANNQQDDVAIIAGQLTYRADDRGNGIAAAGRYYLAVTGVGNAVTPYNDYGSLGRYFISGTVVSSTLKPDFTFTTSGLTGTFTDASTDGDGALNSWSWSFGDGGSSVEQNPSHTFAARGSFTVTLAVTDTLGRNAATSRAMTVTLPNLPPAADFTSSTIGQTVHFTDASSDNDGTIVSRSWNFGDGGSSTLSNPSHVYAAGGSYTVTLTVTDNGGATAGVQKIVAVAGPPAAPSNLTAAVVTNDGKPRIKSVTLNWRDNSSNETGFVIQRCTETGRGSARTCTYADRATVGANATSYRETAGSGMFRYRVRGFNGSGSSAYSNEVRL